MIRQPRYTRGHGYHTPPTAPPHRCTTAPITRTNVFQMELLSIQFSTSKHIFFPVSRSCARTCAIKWMHGWSLVRSRKEATNENILRCRFALPCPALHCPALPCPYSSHIRDRSLPCPYLLPVCLNSAPMPPPPPRGRFSVTRVGGACRTAAAQHRRGRPAAGVEVHQPVSCGVIVLAQRLSGVGCVCACCVVWCGITKRDV